MKKTFAYAVALAMTIISIYSCSNIEIATFEDCYKETAKISENCYVSVADTIQYYDKFGMKAVMNKLNDEIVKFCFGEQFAGKTVEESHKALSDSLRNDWNTNAISLINSDAFSEETAFFYIYEFMNVGSFDTPFKDLQSYKAFKYSYTGGAHGFGATYYMVLDMRSGARVHEYEMFKEGYKAPVSELIYNALLKNYPDMEEEFETFNDFSQVRDKEDNPYINGNCKVSDAGISWNFTPYEIASYAAGHFEVTIPWSDLKPYLSDAFSKII